MSAGDLPKTIETEGKLPPERFANAGELRTYTINMIHADNKRSAWRAQIDGLVNGNPAYSLQGLKDKGQGWRARVNYRESEGLIQAQQTPFFDLVTESNPCIDIDLDYGKGQDQIDWQTSIARNFTWVLMRRWRRAFNFHIPMQQREMLVHGLGTHVWPTGNNNWIPRTLRTGHVLFPDDSSVNFDEEGEAFMLRDFLPLHILYGFIRNESAASKLGWHPKAVWDAMVLTSKTNRSMATRAGTDLEAIQSGLKRGDMGFSVSRQWGMWINHCFVRELDTQKISHYIIPESLDVGDYLFRKRNKFEEWPLVMFPYDVGNGLLHSIRGLGARTKDFFELSNRLKNSMADQVLVGSTFPLQQNGNIDPDKLKLMRLGMMSIIPQGLTVAQGFKFPDLSNGPLALTQHLQDTLRGNNESYLSGTPEPKDRETALSFQMRAQDSAQVSKGTHGLYGSNLCQFYERVLRMMIKASKMAGEAPYIKLAKEFRDRCRKDNVPDAAFDHIEEVREVTSTGAGSAAARIQSLMTIFNTIYPVTSEDRKINIERDLTSALVSGAKVDRYARSANDNALPDSDDSMIAVENDVLGRGGKAVVSPRQNQVRHAQGHLQQAQQIVQEVMQGQMDPAQALQIIQGFGQHIAQHLQQLQNNPQRKAEFAQLHKEWLALSSIADKLQQQVQEAQDSDQPPPEQQLSEQGQIGMAKVQQDGQLKQAKFQQDSALKFRKQAFDQRLQVSKTNAEVARGHIKAFAGNGASLTQNGSEQPATPKSRKRSINFKRDSTGAITGADVMEE